MTARPSLQGFQSRLRLGALGLRDKGIALRDERCQPLNLTLTAMAFLALCRRITAQHQAFALVMDFNNTLVK
jgi:hypothetical protein